MVNIETNPLYFAATGGILLGIATSLNYCIRGKVTGMSGLLAAFVGRSKGEFPEKMAIIGGMLAAAGIFFDIFSYGSSNGFTPFGPAESITLQTSYIGYALSGILVGFGTKLSNGCTSGHGLCGLPRFSLRSFVAVIVFLLTAIAISTIRYYFTLGPLSDQTYNPQFYYNHLVSANVCIAVGLILPILGVWLDRPKKEKKHIQEPQLSILTEQAICWVVGFIFGLGLLVAGMVRRVNILDFLALSKIWNPSLLFVLGCGVMFNVATFNYMLHIRKKNYLGGKLFNPSNGEIDAKLVGGAFCFGLGWGIGGLCPGPAIMQLAVFTVPVHCIWLVGLLIGMLSAIQLDKRLKMLNKIEEAPVNESQTQPLQSNIPVEQGESIDKIP